MNQTKQKGKSAVTPPPLYGTQRAVCTLGGISRPTLQRLEKLDPNAPRPKRLPTGGVIRDLQAWAQYFKNLPVVGANGDTAAGAE